jgi:RNase P subunit p30.
MPFKLKRGPVTEAIKKGIMFEICYSQGIEGIILRILFKARSYS